MSHDGDDNANLEEDAGQVFLLMGKEYRISRSIRAQWFFQQFNSILPQPKSHEELLPSNEELELLSVLSEDTHDNVTDSVQKKYCLVPSTHITFIGRRYRFVFCLDISPSLAIVDIQSGTVITDEVYEKFKNCLSALVIPFSVPGNAIILSPELHITVLAYTSILSPETPQIIIQGCLVTEHNLDTVLDTVHDQLRTLEDILARTVTSSEQTDTKHQSYKTESDSDSIAIDPVTLLSPEAGPIAMLRGAILALQLLPDNASAGAVVITDGVFALPDASAVDSMLAQLRASTVCCSFLKVGSGFHAHCSLGYVPHCDLMQFIAMATSGAYLAKSPPVPKEIKKEGVVRDTPVMNLYHKSLLCWSFQKDYDLSKIDSWIGDSVDLREEDLAWPNLGNRSRLSYALSEWEQNAMQPSMHKKQMESTLHTSITSVLSVRLREGYSIQDVSITKGGKQLEIRLTLPWKQHVQIEYLAIAAWPISKTNRVTHVEVTVSAPYEFLHDVTYPNKHPFTSGYRAIVVKRFWQTMKGLQSNDELLVHLQSFSSNPIYYTIPDSARNGVPLFYLPPNSSNPVLSLQHAKKISKSQESQFAVFWKPVLTLDATVWQRWMHCHRIGLLLHHDMPLPKNLHLPVGNNRFHSIQCRMALSSLNSLFRELSSFVLLENHSYIKFIEGESPDDPPSSFCLIRVSSRAPCIVVRLAFLGGTPGHVRHALTKDIRSKLGEVTAPIGPATKTGSHSSGKKRPGQRLSEEKACVIAMKKPLERILVRYERVPEDLYSPYPEVPLFSVYGSFTGVQYANRTNENHMKVLCQYLFHQRWIWSVPEDGSTHSNADLVARVLGTLTKLRLQEKFNFACSNAGIITMAKEIEMEDTTNENNQLYSCIIQYVMFPPYTKPAGNAVEEWVDEGKARSPETDRKLQMVTEVWIEPQFGVIRNAEKASAYFNGLRYYEVPRAIFDIDSFHVTALLTFDSAWRMCDDQLVSAPAESPVSTHPRRPPSPDRNWTVESIPCPFDVIQLLPKSRQTEMVFSSLVESPTQEPCEHGELPNEILFRLLNEDMEHLNDREIKLTERNCRELVTHVLSRERNKIPSPFPDVFNSTEKENIENSPSEGKCGEEDNNPNEKTPFIKWRCFARSLSGLGCCRLMLTFIPASLKYVKLLGKRQRRTACKSSGKNTVNSTMESQGMTNKHASVIEDVQEALAKRTLTPILEDAEARSTSPTPVPDGFEDPFEFPSDGPPPSVTSSNESHRLQCHQQGILKQGLPCAQSTSAREGGGQSSIDFSEKSVNFKDDDNAPTPTQDNLSPRAPLGSTGEDDDSYCYNIPIYCYDCPLSTLTVVEEKQESGVGNEECRKREDVFQDFTQTSEIFVDPFSLEELPRMVEGRTLGRFGSSKDLLLHCNAVHDVFFRCFVSSIFTSLQSGHQVNTRDVQSAVDTCEENFVEIDITEFIRTLCGHYVKNAARRKSQGAFNESAFLLCQQSQLDIFPRRKVEDYDCVKKLKASLAGECESTPGLHQSIRDMFMSILGRYFKAVPCSNDLYFYSPQSVDLSRKSNIASFEIDPAPEDDTGECNKDDDNEHQDNMFEDDFDVFGFDPILIQDDDLVYPLSESDDSEFGGSSGDSEYGDPEDDEKSLSKPFFLQLTCSLRDRSSHGGGAITPVSVTSLPVCIGEIVRQIEVGEEYLDPFSPSLHITLDLNCLTLSPEPDYSALKSIAPRGYPFRSSSFSSAGSPLSLSPQERSSFEYKRQDSKTTSHDIDGLKCLDPLRSLPGQQRLAMNVTCDSIQWLLQDDIVSELRHRGPVTTSTLAKVERHVQKSVRHDLCIYRDVPLQFVFGAEQSMELFLKEFKHITVEYRMEYHMNKVGDYYYLTYSVDEEENEDVAHDGLQESTDVDGPNSPLESKEVLDNAPAGQSSPKDSWEILEQPTPQKPKQELESVESGGLQEKVASVVTHKGIVSLRDESFEKVQTLEQAGRGRQDREDVDDERTHNDSKLTDKDEDTTIVNDETGEMESLRADGDSSLISKQGLDTTEGETKMLSDEETTSPSVDISTPLSIVTTQSTLSFTITTPADDLTTPVAGYSTPVIDFSDAFGKIHSPTKESFAQEVPRLPLSEAVAIPRKGFSSPVIEVQMVDEASDTSESVVQSQGDAWKIVQTGSPEMEGSASEQGDPSCVTSSPRSPQREKLEFWLVLRMCDNQVDIYFHRRNSEDPHFFSPTMAKGLIETVTNAIHEKSRVVNQRMLLQDLYETKMCNSLLFPEADEDIWKHEDLRMSVSPVGVYISKSDGSGYLNRYVSGEFIFKPGHFQCGSLWSSHLTFHQRLRDPTGRTGISRGRKIIKSVLDRFAVSNRRNMFVYKESSGRVFYLRLLESLCVSDSPEFPSELGVSYQDDEDNALSREDVASVISQVGSHTSSQISLQKAGTEPEDEEPKPRRCQVNSDMPRDTVEQSLALHVYGVDEPGTEITVELLEVLHNRLDEATLDMLAFMLARNPSSKLTFADVRFVQPPGVPPTATLGFAIPPVDEGYLYPLSYYLRQNLLQILHIPRYADSNPNHHFRDNSGHEYGTDPDVFVYNRPQSSGAKGLACISMVLLDSEGERLHLRTSRVPSINVEHLDKNFYEGMTEVYVVSDELTIDDDFIVQFCIWERGDIGLEQLSSQLKCITQHALCDLLIEYLLLPAPLSIIPEKYQYSARFRMRSLSEPPTPSSISPYSRIHKMGSSTEGSEKSSASPGANIGGSSASQSGSTLFHRRKLSSESYGKPSGHRRTPSSGSLGKELISEIPQNATVSQESKKAIGHRRSKSTEMSGRINLCHHRTPSTHSQGKEPVSKALDVPPLPGVVPDSPSVEGNGTPRENGEIKGSDHVFSEGDGNDPKSPVEIDGKNTAVGTVAASLEIASEKKVESGKKVSTEPQEDTKSIHSSISTQLEEVENYYTLSEEKNNRSKGGSTEDEMHTDIDGEFETLTPQEILESQECTSLPGTPVSGNGYILPLKTDEISPMSNQHASKGLKSPGVFPGTSQQGNGATSEASSSLTYQREGLDEWQDIEIRRRAGEEKRECRMKYENGETGELHPNFHEQGRELFSFAHNLGVPSVHLFEGRLLTRYAINFVLGEVSCLISSICPEMKPKVYRQIPRSDINDQEHMADRTCPHYTPGRKPLKAQEDASTVDRSGQSFTCVPGAPCFFVLVARDTKQWRRSLALENETLDDNSSTPSSHARGQENQQRFKPLESSTGLLGVKTQENSSIASVTSCSVPRQRLILLTVLDKELILYTYNLTTDFTQSLENQIQRLLHWSNARCHLTSCLLTQKMGLFHHSLFADINEGKKRKDVNPYCLSANDMDVVMLISRAAPSLHERDRVAPRSLTPVNMLVFDRVLRDVTPPKPLQRTSYSHHRDPVKRHGGQFQEIRSAQINAATIQSTLDELYVTWQQIPPHLPIGDDKLETLKRSCRLIHYCACPLLFHPDWRKKVSNALIHTATEQSKGTKETENDIPQASQRGDRETEETWHKELRCAYIQQYIQYMQSLQFVVVQTRPQSPKPAKSSRRLARRGEGSNMRRDQSPTEAKKQVLSRTNSDSSRLFHQYLQKTSIGGIMLLELLFQDCHFYVRLYSLECSRIPSGKSVSLQISRLFLEDCSHYKNYIHLLSFNYDFHLRQAQSYLSGRQLIFHKGYRVTDLLADVLRQHADYPGYARNHICKGDVAVPCDPVISSINVFKYIVTHSTQYDFSTIKTRLLDKGSSGYTLLGSDRILTPPRHSDSHPHSSLRDEYDITLVASLKNAFEGSVIDLEYFILMTSRRELFPKLSIEPREHRKSSLSSIGARVVPEPGGSTESSIQKGPRVRFALSTSASSSNIDGTDSSKTRLTSSGGFHRSASTPHSMYQMGSETARLGSTALSLSEENIAGKKKGLSLSPHSASSSALSTLDGRTNYELALLTEASQRAHDHLLHVVCRAQTHSKRDLLWYRLLVGGTGEEDKDKEAKKMRRKSEFRRPVPNLASSWNSGIDVEEICRNQGTSMLACRLSFEEFKHLLTVVVCKSLKDTDYELMSLLSMNVSWYLNLFKVLTSKFSDCFRMFSSEDGHVHYLALLNPNELDMFVLVNVDEYTNATDIQIVFRDEEKADADSAEVRHLQKPIKNHIYSVLNSVCFHMWGSLLPL